MGDASKISDNLYVKQQAFFLACHNRGFSFAALGALTGIPAGTLSTYTVTKGRAQSLMALATFIKLARVVPAELSSLLIEDSEHRLCPLDAVATNWDGLAAEAAGLVAEVCTARADGKIDHAEDARLRERTRRLIADAQGAVAG